MSLRGESKCFVPVSTDAAVRPAMVASLEAHVRVAPSCWRVGARRYQHETKSDKTTGAVSKRNARSHGSPFCRLRSGPARPALGRPPLPVAGVAPRSVGGRLARALANVLAIASPRLRQPSVPCSFARLKFVPAGTSGFLPITSETHACFPAFIIRNPVPVPRSFLVARLSVRPVRIDQKRNCVARSWR
jgi:hypothetical protein